MDLDQINRVQSTFAKVSGDPEVTDAFSKAFYEHLFSLDPTVRAMFPDDMTAQRQKLMDELTMIVESLGRLGALVARTTDLGRRHAGYGVEPHHYDLVLEALVHALVTTLPDAVTDDVALAWRRAYHLVAETMLYGAAHPD